MIDNRGPVCADKLTKSTDQFRDTVSRILSEATLSDTSKVVAAARVLGVSESVGLGSSLEEAFQNALAPILAVLEVAQPTRDDLVKMTEVNQILDQLLAIVSQKSPCEHSIVSQEPPRKRSAADTALRDHAAIDFEATRAKVRDLLCKDWKTRDIAKAVGMSSQTLNQLKNGNFEKRYKKVRSQENIDGRVLGRILKTIERLKKIQGLPDSPEYARMHSDQLQIHFDQLGLKVESQPSNGWTTDRIAAEAKIPDKTFKALRDETLDAKAKLVLWVK